MRRDTHFQEILSEVQKPKFSLRFTTVVDNLDNTMPSAGMYGSCCIGRDFAGTFVCIGPNGIEPPAGGLQEFSTIITGDSFGAALSQMEYSSCAQFRTLMGVPEVGIGSDSISPIGVCTTRTYGTSDYVAAQCPSNTVLVVNNRGSDGDAPTALSGRPLSGFGLERPILYQDVSGTWLETLDVLLPVDLGCALSPGHACCCCSDNPQDCVREDNSCRNTKEVIDEVYGGIENERCFFGSFFVPPTPTSGQSPSTQKPISAPSTPTTPQQPISGSSGSGNDDDEEDNSLGTWESIVGIASGIIAIFGVCCAWKWHHEHKANNNIPQPPQGGQP